MKISPRIFSSNSIKRQRCCWCWSPPPPLVKEDDDHWLVLLLVSKSFLSDWMEEFMEEEEEEEEERAVMFEAIRRANKQLFFPSNHFLSLVLLADRFDRDDAIIKGITNAPRYTYTYYCY